MYREKRKGEYLSGYVMEVFAFTPAAMLAKEELRMSRSSPDPNTGRQILYKEASTYEVLYVSREQINCNKVPE